MTEAAQAVQRSAFPTAYAKHEARAAIIVDALTSSAASAGVTTTPITGTASAQPTVMSAADYRLQGVETDAFCSANFELVTASAPVVGADAAIPAGMWTAPLQAAITSAFGMRFHPVFHGTRLHAGTDLHAATGTQIVSPTNGVVESVSWSSGGGLNVSIAHADGVETRHLHLSSTLVKPGDEVTGGQPIALSGDSGVGTGAHYHCEVIVNGTAVDPEPFMCNTE